MADAPSGDLGPEGSSKDPGHGMSWVANQSCAVALGQGHDLASGMKNDAPCENFLTGASFEEGCQCWQAARAISTVQQAKDCNLPFCEFRIESAAQSCCILTGRRLITPAMLMAPQQLGTAPMKPRHLAKSEFNCQLMPSSQSNQPIHLLCWQPDLLCWQLGSKWVQSTGSNFMQWLMQFGCEQAEF